MVLLGLAWPVLAQENLFPILGTLFAILAGFLFARHTPGRAVLPALVGGALAGGISSAVGAGLAMITGQGGPGPIVTALIATLTGLVAGVVGGLFGKLFSAAPTPR